MVTVAPERPVSVGHAPVAVGRVGSRMGTMAVLASELAAPEEPLELAVVELDIPDEDPAPELAKIPELPPENAPAGGGCKEPPEEEPPWELLVPGEASPFHGSLPSSMDPPQAGTASNHEKTAGPVFTSSHPPTTSWPPCATQINGPGNPTQERARRESPRLGFHSRQSSSGPAAAT